MLLKHTPEKIEPRSALTINPAKTCQPIGAMYAALGIHGCFPHSHGSQGCCAYHRSALTRHYKEPVMAGTSSFTEGASVFGGQANLLQAIQNIFSIYDPDIIAVHTTCLSETIGDDVPQITAKADADGKIPEGKFVISASTPSYVGSHVTGFSTMVESMVKAFAEKSVIKTDRVNLIPGWVEPSDMRELKRLMELMGISTIMFPDTSEVLDAPMTGTYSFYPKGGVTIPELKASGSAQHTFALGNFCSSAAAKWLDSNCDVPYSLLDIPIGLSATDRFFMALSSVTGRKIPTEIEDDRGRLIDMIVDMQQYLQGRKVAIYGDPDIILPVAEFLADVEMIPSHIISGTPGKRFTKAMTSILGEKGIEANVANGQGADMFKLHQWIKNEPVDLLIGNTYGKYISRDEDIPFVRLGFPILDRVGHSYFPVVGYKGAMRLLEKILSSLMDKIDRDSPEESFELVM